MRYLIQFAEVENRVIIKIDVINKDFFQKIGVRHDTGNDNLKKDAPQQFYKQIA